MRQARNFTITLTPDERACIIGPVGPGGHQGLHRKLHGQLENSQTLLLTDEEFGKLIRYMTQYGNGGFQARLRRAFARPLWDILETTLEFHEP